MNLYKINNHELSLHRIHLLFIFLDTYNRPAPISIPTAFVYLNTSRRRTSRLISRLISLDLGRFGVTHLGRIHFALQPHSRSMVQRAHVQRNER